MTTKRKKIEKFAHSHKEINQIYQSIPNLMRQAHKEMNPARQQQLQHSTALVWSSILDAMLVRAHADSNFKSGLELQNHG